LRHRQKHIQLILTLIEPTKNNQRTATMSQSKANNSSAVGTSIGSNAPINAAGSAAFCDSSREIHDRTPEMELFSHGRKPRSNFRRPSSLGLAATPVSSKTESKTNYQAKPATRTHIVAPLKDHLKPEGAFEKTSESKGNYRDLSPARPVIHKLQDHLKTFSKASSGNNNEMSFLFSEPTVIVVIAICQFWGYGVSGAAVGLGDKIEDRVKQEYIVTWEWGDSYYGGYPDEQRLSFPFLGAHGDLRLDHSDLIKKLPQKIGDTFLLKNFNTALNFENVFRAEVWKVDGYWFNVKLISEHYSELYLKGIPGSPSSWCFLQDTTDV